MPVHIRDITFGIEIECFVPEGSNAGQAASAINARIGANRCLAQGYNHQVNANWKIVTDGSLGDFQRGIEVVSPILSGAAGIDEAEKVIKALQDFGCSVNKKCGLHVHLGAGNPAFRTQGENIPLGFMKRFAKMYAIFEPVIDSLVPPSRRASANAFCRSITSASLPRLTSAATLDDVIYAVTDSHHGDGRRYHKVNFVAFARYKTVEVRHHSGTLDSNKVKHWIVLCLRMAAAAANGAEVIMPNALPPRSAARIAAAVSETLTPHTPPAPIVPVNRAREGSASWRIGQMMLRPEGVTGPEARAAVNWPSVSMPQQAQICGLEYTTQRTGRTVRYFARTAQAEMAAAAASVPPPPPPPVPAEPPAPPPTPITLLGLMDLIGSELDERQYFLQRQADLGGPIQWAA
jgi:hypothetical protein